MQTDIFENARIKGMCHTYDPETSREAARGILNKREAHYTLILKALENGPMTGKELPEFTGLSQHQIMRRMKELEPFKVVKTGKKRDNANEYRRI